MAKGKTGPPGEWGITEEDRDRIRQFASKSSYDRTPEDLRPGDETEKS